MSNSVRALADLLVGREADAHGRARQLGCAARYATAAITSAMPALSSAPSSVSPLVVTMSWPSFAVSSGIRSGSSTRAAARQLDRAAVVAAVHERLDAGAGLVGARVQMRQQADRRRARHVAGRASPSRSRSRPDRRVAEPEPHAAPRPAAAPSSSWPGRARRLRVRAVRLRVDADVADEAVEHVGCERPRRAPTCMARS